MAVVKSDAYGHGLVKATQALYEAGARTFGVAEVDEGIALRKAGLGGEIIVLLGPVPETVDDIIRHSLTPVLFNPELLDKISQRAVEFNKKVGVHVKVDVGMGRLGVMPEELFPFCETVERLPGVFLSGVLSHLPLADDLSSAETVNELRRFRDIMDRLMGHVPAKPVAHVANSAALAYNHGTHLDMVRPGITLYGCYPVESEKNSLPFSLKPVMSFKTRVIQVKEVPAGYGISYGHIFITRRPTRIAVLPVGYDDGYLRKLSNRAEVLIHGQRAPVRGRVCMNACMVDVTDLQGAPVKTGDEVVLLGRQKDGAITAEEVAGWLETINYEVCCLFGNRNRRVYI